MLGTATGYAITITFQTYLVFSGAQTIGYSKQSSFISLTDALSTSCASGGLVLNFLNLAEAQGSNIASSPVYCASTKSFVPDLSVSTRPTPVPSLSPSTALPTPIITSAPAVPASYSLSNLAIGLIVAAAICCCCIVLPISIIKAPRDWMLFGPGKFPGSSGGGKSPGSPTSPDSPGRRAPNSSYSPKRFAPGSPTSKHKYQQQYDVIDVEKSRGTDILEIDVVMEGRGRGRGSRGMANEITSLREYRKALRTPKTDSRLKLPRRRGLVLVLLI